MPYPNIWIVLPAYNEARVIDRVLRDIQKAGYNNIIVVDDGSDDNTYKKAQNVSGITTLRHRINRGKGAATKTGIETAKHLGADIIVTMDADGQHDPKDIDALTTPIQKGEVDVTLGTRFSHAQDIPPIKRTYNKLGNLLTWYLYGLMVTDSQSGLRAYSRRAADHIDTKGDSYEYESEVIYEIRRHRLSHTEVPIRVFYTEYSQTKPKRQNLTHGCKTAYKMLWRIIH